MQFTGRVKMASNTVLFGDTIFIQIGTHAPVYYSKLKLNSFHNRKRTILFLICHNMATYMKIRTRAQLFKTNDVVS